jgi:hypothetical protein
MSNSLAHLRTQAAFRHESSLQASLAMPSGSRGWSGPTRVVHDSPRAGPLLNPPNSGCPISDTLGGFTGRASGQNLETPDLRQAASWSKGQAAGPN